MIAHSFLWALARTEGCTTIAEATYRRLAAQGDIQATHKLAVLTGFLVVHINREILSYIIVPIKISDHWHIHTVF